MNEVIKLSALVDSPELAKFSKNARTVAGTFFGHLPTKASVRFTMKHQVPTEFTRHGLIELVNRKVLKCTIHADESQVYQILEDCTGFLKFRDNPMKLLQPVNRRGR